MIQTAPVLERFNVVRPLAVGGMGELFLANDAETGQRAVLKVLRDDIGALGSEKRFEHEIQVLRRISRHSHPLIPPWLADGEWDGRRVVAVGHVAGMSLAELMARLSHRVSVTTAVLLAIDVLNALHQAHRITTDDGVCLGLVHRDVSPHNIVCDLRGRAHLIDFGVSVDVGFADATPGMLIGKIAYMAPEQASAAEVDARTDQFALGVVLWELLTGYRLFLGDSDRSTWSNVQSGVVPAIELFADVPRSISTTVCRMLEPRPTARFGSCGDAADALLRAAMDLPLGEFSPIATLEEAMSSPPPVTSTRIAPLSLVTTW